MTEEKVEEKITEAEERFERYRKTCGFFLAPVVFILLLLLPFPALTSQAHKLLAILGLVITFWITESIPIPITAILGAALCIILGVEKDEVVLSPFAHPIVFLFIGSFILAEAMRIHHLDKRFAYAILSFKWVGNSSLRVIFAIGAISAIISMWISNTAATAMIFPIALGILRVFEDLENQVKWKKLNTGMMLIVAYAASIGGIATPVGTPPNLIGIGMIEKLMGIKISFFEWMLFALPLTIFVFILLYFLIILIHKPERKSLVGIKEFIKEKRNELGPWTKGQRNSLIAFSVAVTLWIFPGIIALIKGSNSPQLKFYNLHIPESVAALVAISTLFFIPTNWRQRKFTLSWKEAVKIDWGTILLFGGGLTLGSLMFSTKLASALGDALLGITGANSLWGITALAIALGIILSETTSNTASANMVIPIMIAISQAAGINPLPPALGACLGASFGFMLPVSTPPNAIVYSSGMIPITKMIKTGIIFDILGFFAIFFGLRILLPILGI